MIGYTKAVSKRGKREKARNNKRLAHIFVQIALPREISMTRVDVRSMFVYEKMASEMVEKIMEDFC